ncbi:MAG: cell division protein ZapA [Clostridium sp.]|uniref:cell division protein ZapA n=1 Tax=Clostridium culturomicium TaxID=1499683 RepID=UPI000694CE3F|nr:cell division protein ZapA [Clostridium culturomicium]MDU4892038.1 cell division protein ZapA [Clostridium sp.]MDU7082425.1 cell division protein ZapA [Clostridium sp.]
MNIITVKINGMEYNLRGEENNEYLQMVAQYIDNKINSLMIKNTKISRPDATILAAINLGDEVFKNKEAFERVNENYKLLSREHKELISETEMMRRDYEAIYEENTTLNSALRAASEKLKTATEELESENVKELQIKLAEFDKLFEAKQAEFTKFAEEKQAEIEALKQQLAVMEEVEAKLKDENRKQQGFSKKLLAENNRFRYQEMAKVRKIEELTRELEDKNFKLIKLGQAPLIKK